MHTYLPIPNQQPTRVRMSIQYTNINTTPTYDSNKRLIQQDRPRRTRIKTFMYICRVLFTLSLSLYPRTIFPAKNGYTCISILTLSSQHTRVVLHLHLNNATRTRQQTFMWQWRFYLERMLLNEIRFFILVLFFRLVSQSIPSYSFS